MVLNLGPCLHRGVLRKDPAETVPSPVDPQETMKPPAAIPRKGGVPQKLFKIKRACRLEKTLASTLPTNKACIKAAFPLKTRRQI